MTSDVVTSLSPDELALYDRQIRLWGVGTQQLIRQAKVALIVGRQELLFQEILKNLLLNGIGRIALYLLPCDFSSTNGSIFTNLSEWAADLNPTVSLIECSPSLIDYRQHDLVMLIELKEEEKILAAVDEAHLQGIPHIWVSAEGSMGILANDFGPSHAYWYETREEDPKTQDTVTRRHERKVGFGGGGLRAAWEAHKEMEEEQMVTGRQRTKSKYSRIFKHFQQNSAKSHYCYYYPSTAAMMGAVAVQEAFKAVTKRDPPISGVLTLDGSNLETRIIHF